MLRDVATKGNRTARTWPERGGSVEAVDTAKRANVYELAVHYTMLRREAAREYAGPCPRCQGEDRFHCTHEWWFCRTCHPERGDAIEFIRWLTGAGFREAVGMLTGVPMPANPSVTASQQRYGQPVTVNKPKSTPPEVQARLLAQWQADAEAETQRGEAALANAAGGPGRAYLESRGLLPASWQTFRLGFVPDVPLPGTRGQQRAPAILMPWTSAGKVVAIRYRFLERHTYTDSDGRERKNVKQSAKPRAFDEQSLFGGRMFGGLGMLGAAEHLRDLVICEGEINAISIWQAAHPANVDVLSLGSESQHLTDVMLKHITRYRRVIVWMDQTDKLQALCDRIPGATGIASPHSMDANDCLRKGTLQAMIADLRLRACTDDAQREALLWDLWDHHNERGGVDEPTQALIAELRGRLGK